MPPLPSSDEVQNETTSRVVELFKFYWDIFLKKQQILQDEEKMLADAIHETEREAKMQRIHEVIDKT